MDIFKNLKGYRQTFLGKGYTVPMPTLSDELESKVVRRNNGRDYILRYARHSVIQHKERRFPILSAAIIDGQKFKRITRTELFPNGRDNWKKDKRIDYDYQWGRELYTFEDSDFDMGHLTKREDVQWGETYDDARKHAQMTFYFTNAVPQCPEVNQGLWRKLEDYILKEEVLSSKTKCCVFTGCVLKDNDPIFIHEVRDEEIKLPVLFWKVIYYINSSKELCRVAYLVGQRQLLTDAGIIRISRGVTGDELFSDFEEAKTHQVNISLIEELTDMTFAPAKDVFQDDRPREVILEDVELLKYS